MTIMGRVRRTSLAMNPTQFLKYLELYRDSLRLIKLDYADGLLENPDELEYTDDVKELWKSLIDGFVVLLIHNPLTANELLLHLFNVVVKELTVNRGYSNGALMKHLRGILEGRNPRAVP